jgi:hypothetical protein
MPLEGFEPKTAVFERAKTRVIHALDRAATAIGTITSQLMINKRIGFVISCNIYANATSVLEIFKSNQTSLLMNLLCSNQSWKGLILSQVRIPPEISVCVIFIITNHPSLPQTLHPTHHTEALPHASYPLQE